MQGAAIQADDRGPFGFIEPQKKVRDLGNHIGVTDLIENRDDDAGKRRAGGGDDARHAAVRRRRLVGAENGVNDRDGETRGERTCARGTDRQRSTHSPQRSGRRRGEN